MKRISLAIVLVAAAAVGVFGVMAYSEGDSAWLDLENCSMCKSMHAEEGLMENMKWENHKIATGMMSVTVVDPAFEDAYGRSMKAMHEMGQRMHEGEQMPLCGFCKSMGKLMMDGAKMENFDTNGGHVMLITAMDPKVINDIHDHVTKTQDEFAKMTAAHEEGHEYGHDQANN